MIEIDKPRADHDRTEYHAREGFGRSELDPAKEEQCGGEQFDGGVAKAKRPATAAGAASQQEPAEHGKIIIPSNRLSAATVRSRSDNRFILGDAIDADVKKATDACAKQRDGEREKPWKEVGDLNQG